MAMPSKAPSLWARIYQVVEKAMPWRYTGVYSHPEFKSHVPVVGHTRPHAPTNPPFRPVTPAMENERILDTKLFKQQAQKMADMGNAEVTDESIKKMNSWLEKTPLGTPRFRWQKSRQYIYDYPDNGYR